MQALEACDVSGPVEPVEPVEPVGPVGPVGTTVSITLRNDMKDRRSPRGRGGCPDLTLRQSPATAKNAIELPARIRIALHAAQTP